jgi:superkiller protein 3
MLVLVSSGCTACTENRDSGNATHFMEKGDSVQKYYDSRVAAEPDNAEAWCIRGMYYNDNYGQYEEAMASCNRALELDPNYGLAWFVKGIILTNMNETGEAALCFENATRCDPELEKELPSIVGDAG